MWPGRLALLVWTGKWAETRGHFSWHVIYTPIFQKIPQPIPFPSFPLEQEGVARTAGASASRWFSDGVTTMLKNPPWLPST